jgi:uncharacterized protein (TIGR03437 family)
MLAFAMHSSSNFPLIIIVGAERVRRALAYILPGVLVLCMAAVSWAAIPFDAQVRAVAVDPSDSNRMYALTVGGVLKSDNRGATWEQLPIFPPGSPQPSLKQLEFDATNPAIIYVLAEGETHRPLVGIWRSQDRGATWTRISEPETFPDGSFLRELLVAPTNGAVLYVNVVKDGISSAYQSVNGGDTWTVIGGVGVGAVSPSDENTVYSGASPGAVLRSTDGGKTFTQVGQVNPAVGFLSGIAVSPDNANLVLVSGQTGIFRSTNAGATFERVHTGSMRSVAFNPQNPSEVIAGDFGSSSYYSSDMGASFELLSREVLGDAPLFSLSVDSVCFDHGVSHGLIHGRSMGGSGLVTMIASIKGEVWKRLDGVYTPMAIPSTQMHMGGRLLSGDSSQFNSLVTIRAAEGGAPGSHGLTIGSPEGGDASTRIEVVRDGSDPNQRIPQVRLIRSGQNVGPGVYASEMIVPVTGAINPTVSISSSFEVADKPEPGGVYLGGLWRPEFDSIPIRSITSHGGSLYIGSVGKIYVLPLGGELEEIAGTGIVGYSGDGGPAAEAQIGLVNSISVGSDGTVYFHDHNPTSTGIRRIRTDGIVEMVAGTSDASAPMTILPGAAADAIRLVIPPSLAVRANGDLLLGHSNAIWRLDGNTFQLVAGGGSGTPSEGAMASQVSLSLPSRSRVLIDDHDRIAFVHTHHPTNQLFRIRDDGSLELLLGAEPSKAVAGSSNATEVAIEVRDFAIRDNELYFVHHRTKILHRVRPDGILEEVGLTGVEGVPSQCTGARYVPNKFSFVDSVLSLPDGTLVVGHIDLPRFWIPPASSVPGDAPSVPPEGVVNAASFGRALSPGSLVSIFGTDVAADQAAATALPLPAKLGDGVACVAGQVAPMIFASPLQLNVQLPFGLEPGIHTLRVFNRAGGTVAVPIEVQAATPEIFRDGGRAVVINPNGSVNSSGNGVAPGQVVVAYLTGVGDLEPPVETGAASPLDPLAIPKLERSASLGGVSAPLHFLGMTPGFAGLAQANVEIPSLEPGEHEIVITVGEYSSDPLPITVK